MVELPKMKTLSRWYNTRLPKFPRHPKFSSPHGAGDGRRRLELAEVPDSANEPKIVLLMRLLGAIEEGRHDFEGLKVRVSSERPPGTRTLRRYLAILADAGFPWYFDRDAGTYRFHEGYGMRRLHLSPRELLGLLAIRGIASSLGGNLASSVNEITQKLIGVADRPTSASTTKPAVHIHMSGVALDAERTKVFELLQNAQRESRTVRFSYVDKRGRRSERKVDPYGFVVSGGRAYLVAHDHSRAAKRVFALDAIGKARLDPRRFEPRADFDIEVFAARSISGIMHAEKPARVTVRFSPVVANAAKADRIVGDRTVTERADGSVDIAYGVDDADELIRWSLRWGAEAEVVGPAAARAAARKLVARIAARYAQTAQKQRRPPIARRPR
jgi:predicted DNA-binding transcriptional regulator YafY